MKVLIKSWPLKHHHHFQWESLWVPTRVQCWLGTSHSSAWQVYNTIIYFIRFNTHIIQQRIIKKKFFFCRMNMINSKVRAGVWTHVFTWEAFMSNLLSSSMAFPLAHHFTWSNTIILTSIMLAGWRRRVQKITINCWTLRIFLLTLFYRQIEIARNHRCPDIFQWSEYSRRFR